MLGQRLVRHAARHQHTVASIVPPVWESSRPGAHFAVAGTGFLPTTPPLRTLPEQFEPLESLMRALPVVRPDGSPGLLAQGGVGDAVAELPLLEVGQVSDPALQTALFRDYSILLSTFLLEPTHQTLMDTGEYGEARARVPAQIAVPMMEVAEQLEAFPFLDYAYGYSLNNYYLEDPSAPPDFDNLRAIRQFHGSKEEEGFILVHTAIEQLSPELLRCQQAIITAAHEKNQDQLCEALDAHADCMEKVYEIFCTMWKRSKPKAYLEFRTFIMGMTGNAKIFPHGHALYEGRDGTDSVHAYRGETGAQDSLIPSCDNLLQISYPLNQLTKYLFELRQYRPHDHQAYLDWVQQASLAYEVKQQALESNSSAIAFLRNLDVVQRFRSMHWSMTKSYIIDATKHPVATGGTPITSWLPNQLGATLEAMQETVDTIEARGGSSNEAYGQIRQNMLAKLEALMQEVMGMQSRIEAEQAQEAGAGGSDGQLLSELVDKRGERVIASASASGAKA